MSLIDKLFDKTETGLEKALDLAHQRSQALISNISNAETPGYRAVDLDFKAELARAFNGQSGQELKKTDPRHMDVSSQSGARLVADNAGATKADGNNVDIDIMMTRMQQNQGRYTDAASILRKKLRFFMTAIRSAER